MTNEQLEEEISKLKAEKEELIKGFKNLLAQYRAELEIMSLNDGLKFDDFVKDLITYNESIELIQKHRP